MLGAEADLPVEAGDRAVVDDRVRMGDEQMSAGNEGGGEPAREPP